MGALLGHRSWRLFSGGITYDALLQQVFNLSYHLHQQVTDVLKLPTRMRMDLWKKLIKQYDFEKDQQ